MINVMLYDGMYCGITYDVIQCHGNVMNVICQCCMNAALDTMQAECFLGIVHVM